MTASEFIGQHLILKEPDTTDPQIRCGICGSVVSGGFKLKRSVSSKFNSWQYVKYHSEHICQYCKACLDMDSMNGKALRNYSVLVETSGITILDKAQIPPLLISPPKPPFLTMVTFTRKKHIFFKASINQSRERFAVATDKLSIVIEPEAFKERYDLCSALYQSGFSKREILTGRYRKYKKMEEMGDSFFSIESRIAPFRYSFYMEFLIHILTKEAENDTH